MRWLPLGAGMAALWLSACSSPNTQAVREVMRTPIAPASDALFNAVVYTNGELVSAPKTDAQWSRLREQAQALLGSASTVESLAPEDNADQWRAQTRALANASREALNAVDGKSLDGLLDAGGKVYATCTGCHGAYMERAD